MHQEDLARWQHSHSFGAEDLAPGERRTRWVVALTFAMMLVEIAAGSAFGSMALLADGWHMATHAAALGGAALAYGFARRRARDPSFSFGTGKVGALAGFGGAVSLGLVAVLVLAESAGRLLAPSSIRCEEALAVAGAGLLVNLASALLLRKSGQEESRGAAAHPDHNLRGAYFHVLADALTSLLAIAALAGGRFLGWTWMDAATGVLGSLLIARWSLRLLRDTGRVLLDAEAPEAVRRQIRAAVEGADDRVADLHLWRVGPRHLAAIVSVVTHEPRAPEHYKEALRRFPDLAHVTVEVHRCEEAGPPAP